MKRGADNYITKDDAEEDREGEEEAVPTEGFRKADDTVLAARRIRALPKRVGGSPAPAPSTNGIGTLDDFPPPSPKFSGFAGFGTPSNSFTFPTPSQPSSTSTQPIPPGSPFTFQSSTPTVASTASNTAKTFASFLTDPLSSKPTTPAPKSLPPSSEQRSDPEDAAALKYYTSIRGLNVSFLNALSLAVEKDPFTDATTVLERYKSLRSTVQKEFDVRSSNSANVFSSASTTPVSNPSPTPAPTFSGFATTSSSTPQTGSSTLPAASSSAPPPGFLFPTPSSTPGASPRTSVPPAATTWTSVSPATPFGSSIFNISGTTSSSPSNSSLTVGSSTTPFGGSSLSTSNLFGNDKSASSASFFGNTQSSAASSSKPSTPFGSFGGFAKPAGGVGSIGNPVGFVFGNPLKAPDADGNGSAGSKSAAPVEPAEPPSTESKEATPQPEGERRDDAGSGLLGSNPHDEEGEGEEQEDTVYSVKLRAFRMKREEEKGGPGWVELGYGVLRLKKHKESEVRRVLLRNSSTGRININFILYSGLKPSQTKKVVTFVGHDDGVSQTYSVRLQSEEQAAKLKEALDREISLVKVAE